MEVRPFIDTLEQCACDTTHEARIPKIFHKRNKDLPQEKQIWKQQVVNHRYQQHTSRIPKFRIPDLQRCPARRDKTRHPYHWKGQRNRISSTNRKLNELYQNYYQSNWRWNTINNNNCNWLKYDCPCNWTIYLWSLRRGSRSRGLQESAGKALGDLWAPCSRLGAPVRSLWDIFWNLFKIGYHFTENKKNILLCVCTRTCLPLFSRG